MDFPLGHNTTIKVISCTSIVFVSDGVNIPWLEIYIWSNKNVN